MIDFHSHLDLYPDGLALAREVNDRNEFTLVVTTSPRAFRATSRVFSGFNNIHVGLGLHPEVAESKAIELDALISDIASVRFVGEVGLDGSARFRKSFALQERIFKAAIDECSIQGGKIISIHSRGAVARVLEILATSKNLGCPVLHWFSGGITELEFACKLGCWFSVGPSMLAGEKGKNLVSRMPYDRILPETDGPFASTRGMPLMPWDAWDVCVSLSKIWNWPLEAVEDQIRQNLSRLLSR